MTTRAVIVCDRCGGVIYAGEDNGDFPIRKASMRVERNQNGVHTCDLYDLCWDCADHIEKGCRDVRVNLKVTTAKSI